MSTASPSLDDVFRSLADPTRRGILDQLRHTPANTKAVCDANTSLTRGGVINHIKILEAAGLIRVEERGRERINHLNATPLQDVHERWLTPFEQLWATKLRNLTHTAEAINNNEDHMDQHPVRVVTIVQQSTCAASPSQIWEALTRHTATWWSTPYVSEASTDLTLSLEPGGTLWDSRADGSGYALGTVRGFTPERELILDGEFGIPDAIHGRLNIDIVESGDSATTVTFTHTAIGEIAPDSTGAHETGWAVLLQQLTDAAAGMSTA